MGLKERQEREREATARAILDAARDLFVAEGYSSLSIRKIADRIEYSPAAIYSYFPSKDDIFLALAEEGFQMLRASAQCVREADPDARPLDSIRNAMLTIFEFSKAHPEYHALMFLDRSVPKISRDWQRFGFVREMRGQLVDLIRIAIEHGDFARGSDPEVILRVLMVATHGVASIHICDRLIPGEDVDALARVTVEAVLTGFRTGFSHSYRPDVCF